MVEWLLGTRCNFACSYCPAELHDGSIRWPEWGDLERFCRRVFAQCRDREVTFLFTGGEPTMYRHLIAAADLVHDLGGHVAMLSNGTRSLRWWADAVGHFDEVILSFHAEQADPDHFVAVAELVGAASRLQANVVMVPALLDRCVAMADRIEAAVPDAVVSRKPLMDRWEAVHRYESEEHRRISAAVAQAPRPPAGVLKGDLIAEDALGNRVRVTAVELLLLSANRWEGWTCSAGVETLFVRGEDVYRASCRAGGRLGGVRDPDLRLPTEPISCTFGSCNCIAGIKATKHLPVDVGERPVTVAPRR